MTADVACWLLVDWWLFLRSCGKLLKMSKDRSFSTAIHLLIALAFNDERLVSSEELARGLCTNPGLVRRVLSKLSQAGLIETTKGKLGGSRLARRAKDISLDDVYLAVAEGHLFGVFDKEPFEPCPVSRTMNGILCDLYGELETSLLEKMTAITLDSLLKKVK